MKLRRNNCVPKETKSNGQKDPLDRFYTPDEIVQSCLALLDLTKYDCIIEPSAGMGNFSKYLPNCYAYDICPMDKAIITANWLDLDKAQFKHYSNILVCGNPPFGEQNKLAIAFFNEAAKFCNTIAFILPLSFKKTSIQNMLDLSFSLSRELILDNAYFYLQNKDSFHVPCVFQVWEKTSIPRKKIKQKTTSELFVFTTKENADFRIQRVGGNAGKASSDLNRSISSNYFIKNLSTKTNEEFIEFINNLSYPTISFTVGPKSLSKGELIETIESNWDNF